MITIQTEHTLSYEINYQILQDAIAMTLSAHEKTKHDVTLRLTDDDEIHQLNYKFRKQDKPTDVLSFNYNFIDPETGHDYLGDIIISLETAIRQAEEHDFTIDQELAFLVIHGTLHLLGYDHQTPNQKKTMFQLQKEIFNKLIAMFEEEKNETPQL